jgi:hypothetical protein
MDIHQVLECGSPLPLFHLTGTFQSQPNRRHGLHEPTLRYKLRGRDFMSRLPYEDSCRALQSQQIIDGGDIPPLLQRAPRHDDDVLGVGFFRTMLADSSLEHLSLPRTFFGRSEIRAVSFKDTDLSESTANWNDFIDVAFSSADLSQSDLRACLFEGVKFVGASLVGADLRYCGFKSCDFSAAEMTDAKLTRKAGASLRLSVEQQSAIDWQAEDGEEPAGG